ncbi:hypothetical protein K437DRAFT_259097 [Tilletiaria anomala UBC 951]|uniref:GATA-type domain-containing protein n=1 Tax=Tilletiaria anomala (strain ATCC 24038 / CBS 436.72 / UBC 951) TaxID=1037660 RepID=A0A066VCY9_TILAU|nr:uncharacterized protein K437DRAFT_259097 [Tilletiaria anomala UBC 951]KDN39311.1 hypothetical protein K437DRAFT_259097 [Tilletiaria anomala UBC 951]
MVYCFPFQIYALSHEICAVAAAHMAHDSKPCTLQVHDLLDGCLRGYDLLQTLISEPDNQASKGPFSSNAMTSGNGQDVDSRLKMHIKLPPITTFYRAAADAQLSLPTPSKSPMAHNLTALSPAASSTCLHASPRLFVDPDSNGGSDGGRLSLPAAGASSVADSRSLRAAIANTPVLVSPLTASVPSSVASWASYQSQQHIQPHAAAGVKRRGRPRARSAVEYLTANANGRVRSTQAYYSSSVSGNNSSKSTTTSTGSIGSAAADTKTNSGGSSSKKRGPPVYAKRCRRPAEVCCECCRADDSPEWRKGPSGPRTLCNACGLHYSKLIKIDRERQQLPMKGDVCKRKEKMEQETEDEGMLRNGSGSNCGSESICNEGGARREPRVITLEELRHAVRDMAQAAHSLLSPP